MRRTMNDPQVVVVTGASAGVGRAVAVAFAEHGAAVALLARGEAGLAGRCVIKWIKRNSVQKKGLKRQT